MGQTLMISASDGHPLSAYFAEPPGSPRGGIVVIQEIFGVTRHIRAVTDQYAAAGYAAIAPALFDRIEPNIDVPYADMQKGFEYMQKLKNDEVLLDIQAGIDRVAGFGKVGSVGYCWGGTMSYLASTRLPLAAAVIYYGGGVNRFLAERPLCPVMFHFGARDAHIPASVVAQVRKALPDAPVHVYDAEHGFNCADRASFEPNSAQLAFERTQAFFHQHLG